MKDAAKLILDGRIGRRSFIARLTGMGMASTAASRLAGSLAAAPLAGTLRQSPRAVISGTGGELTAEFLREWDVPYVFGLGGSEEVGFLDALVDRLDLQYVQGLHEGSVMSMADGYARAAGETAFVNLHSVSGTGYALGPMVNAFKDGTPLVITVGRQSTTLRGGNAFLEAVNLHQLPRDYARWTWDVMGADTIPDVLRRAFLLAAVPPGGPTFVTVSKDLWEERVEDAEIVSPARTRVDREWAPEAEQVVRAVDMLVEAQLPFITAGRELNRYGGIDDLVAIAELLGAPVFMDVESSHTPVVYPISHPSYVGLLGEAGDSIGEPDLFWSVGGTMFTVGAPPREPFLPSSARVIHTSMDTAQVGRNQPVDLPMVANVKLAASEVLRELQARSLEGVGTRRAMVEAFHRARASGLEADAAARWDQRPIASARLAVDLLERMAPDAIVVSELVTSEPFLKNYMDIGTGPTKRLNITSSGGVLGWGLGAAIGAKIAQPTRQVFSLLGDGSFQFGVQALWSAVRYEVPIGIVVWNNGGYQANRRFLHSYGGRAAETGKYVGASLRSPDIDNVAIASGYGVDGEKVEDPTALGAALDRCFRTVAEGRPYLLDVSIERRWGGATSEWYDHFSVAKNQPRQS